MIVPLSVHFTDEESETYKGYATCQSKDSHPWLANSKTFAFSLFLSIFSKNVLPDFLSEKLKQAGEIRELQLDLKQNLPLTCNTVLNPWP